MTMTDTGVKPIPAYVMKRVSTLCPPLEENKK